METESSSFIAGFFPVSSVFFSLSPVSPLYNTFALPAEVFSLCLAIVSAVMVGGLFL